ncbi:hypothetical protein BFJ63_vAg13959 [Fusarium oxysporum f. sp. narcissi]|jgi:hypothetical protein|uniref:Uncharacterized protein n=2 Tax=Fusarium TaxID=5506 RepID=A0A4Q2VG33_FUSOX|nr:hypothetical protein BFJ72_g14371 [Fusarium proliferatum]RYC83127.1 hypothetical protein BFJ63_vAg13959 [Fusarium oxysporum f. sp. narcissi]
MQATSSTDPSLALLEETAAYLRRLPLVPSTQELIRKIEAHLASPSRQAAAIAALEPIAWEGQVTTVAGTVLFSVSVENGQASLLAPVTRPREHGIRAQQAVRRPFLPTAGSSHPDDPMETFQGPPLDAMQAEAELDRARLLRLHMGVTVELKPSRFPSSHALLVEESRSNIKGWR